MTSTQTTILNLELLIYRERARRIGTAALVSCSALDSEVYQ